MAEKPQKSSKAPITNRSAYWPPEERPSTARFTDGYYDYIFNPAELDRYTRDPGNYYVNDNAYRIVNEEAPGVRRPDLRIEYGPEGSRKTILVPYGEQIPENLVFSELEKSSYNYDDPSGPPWEEAKWEFVDKKGNVVKQSGEMNRAFHINPELRYLGAIDDLRLSGAIRGSFGFGGESFFNKARPAEGYRDPSRTNYYIEVTPDYLVRASDFESSMEAFKDKTRTEMVSKNPLYNIGRGSHTKKRGVNDPDYRTLNPKKQTETRFVDRINPENRKGMKIIRVNTDGLEVEYRPTPKEAIGEFAGENYRSYPKYVTQPKEKVIYDGITPFKERTLGQHYRNAKFNAQAVLIQPEVKAAAKYAADVGKGAAKIGLNAAGLAGYAGAVYEKGPLAAVEWGIPFTPLKMGIGPINTLNAPEKAPYHTTEQYREEARQRTASEIEKEIEARRNDNPAFKRKPAETLELNFDSTMLKEFIK